MFQEELMLNEDSVPEMCSPFSKMGEQEKNYYCQRCLNHGERNPRKGHKPECGYLKCPCRECNMVEQRRQLNNLLSKKRVQCTPTTATTKDGKRVRDPHCARCSAHGVLVPLRGHKRSTCQFVNCTCTLCALVEHRRNLMAAQIKLRRSQQKSRDGKEKGKRGKNGMRRVEIKSSGATSPSSSSTTDTMSPTPSMSPPSTPPPPLPAPIPIHPLSLLNQQVLFLSYLQQQSTPPPIAPPINDQWGAILSLLLKVPKSS